MKESLVEELEAQYPADRTDFGCAMNLHNGMECDDGWLSIISTCLARLHAVAKRTSMVIPVCTLKEKFGTLRVYLDAYDCSDDTEAEIQLIVDDAETLSETTCESCGDAGVLRRKGAGGWLRTTCDRHAEAGASPLSRDFLK